jgi:hypothetical protein
MAGRKPQKQKKSSTETRSTKSEPSKKASSSRSLRQENISNALLFLRPVLFIGIVILLISSNKGYDRLYKINVVRMFKDLERYKGMDYDQRLRKMLPQDYPFLSDIRDKTPADAVLLAPPKAIWHPEGRKLGFGTWIHSPSYLAYFLYPRKVIIDDKKGAKSPLMNEVTHVLIVDSWGYDKLKYQVPDRQPFAVLPIQK